MSSQYSSSARTDELKDDVKDATNAVKDMAYDAKDMAHDAKAAVEDSAHKAAAAARDVSDRTREKVGELKASGSDALDRGGDYLQQLDIADVKSDVTALVRRHPMEALVVGLALGYLAARAARS